MLESRADAAMTYFYGQLFAMDHEIRAMFPAAMDQQRRRSFRALARIARGAGEDAGGQDSAALDSYLQELGRAHRKFGVRERHYDAFRQALMATLRKFAAERWDAAAREAWLAAFDRAAGVMIDGARRDAAHSPAWWTGTVTAKEPRGPDLAVLTIRPDQPLSYLPGQYVSVQTPHWPRLWRRYSIANAPRPDGTLRLHVRAITGGLVSPTLVHQVRVGEPLVIGAPAGTMTADTGSARDVLCLAGGTGLAPVKAIIEAIIRTPAPGQRREIVLYHGGRRRQDLYDLADLRQVEVAYPWLRVISVVSDEAVPDDIGGDVMYGTVPELAATANWFDRDVYISGPDAMIRRTARVLDDLGAPRHLVHYDLG